MIINKYDGIGKPIILNTKENITGNRIINENR
jgi:hypothetical protein